MSPAAAEGQSSPDRASLYQEITDRIVVELEVGIVPWVQPWGRADGGAGLGLPRNAASGRHYSGINVLILWGAVFQQGFSCQSWLTRRQALALGGHVHKDQAGTMIVYAARFTPRQGRMAARGGDKSGTIPFLKRFIVFNTDQCGGLPEHLVTTPPPISQGLILPQAEALIRATGADLRIGGDRAFYSPGLDVVHPHLIIVTLDALDQ